MALTNPLVSIIVPTYNVETYLDQCLDALQAQTLKNIEVIVVNDGSTDQSGVIAHAHAQVDTRIRVIDKPNSGYGASMNRGIAEARGAYIGIAEPDDYVERSMYKKLAKYAVRYSADVVKCNYFAHLDGRDEPFWNFDGHRYRAPFDPVDDPSILFTSPTIWCGIYNRAWLERERIDFRETPGASYQDAAFSLKVWAAAHTCVLVKKPLLHYRLDNPDSSSKSTDKVFCVCDELENAQEFMRRYPDRYAKLIGWYNVGRFDKYRWNWERIADSAKVAFAERMKQEFSAAREAGEIDWDKFLPEAREHLQNLLSWDVETWARTYRETF